MFKFLRKKLLKGMINDFINDMPKYKTSAKLLMLEKGDELVQKLEDTIKNYLKKHLGEF